MAKNYQVKKGLQKFNHPSVGIEPLLTKHGKENYPSFDYF